MQRIANKYFTDEKARIVLVGKAADILENVEKIKWNGSNLPIKYFDKKANPTEKPEISKPIPEGVTALTVMEDYIEAIGGKSAVDNVNTLMINAEVTIEGAPFKPTAVLKSKSPNKMSMEMSIAGMGTIMKQKFDGNTDQTKKQYEIDYKDVTAEIQKFTKEFQINEDKSYKFINNGLFGYTSYDAVKYFESIEISDKKIRDSLIHFKGAPHRMEPVLTIQKVQYINDSKATNVNATYFALESINTPIIWILGGVDKGNDYSTLLPLVRKKVKGIICLGVDNRNIIDVFGSLCDNLIETTSINEAVKIGHKLSSPKETVLLSPCCSSFDLFKNYEDRGDQFKSAVRNL